MNKTWKFLSEDRISITDFSLCLRLQYVSAQPCYLSVFKALIFCSSWIFALILIFCKSHENITYLVYCFWRPLKFCTTGECCTCLTLVLDLLGPPPTPGPWGPSPWTLQAGRAGGVPLWLFTICATWSKLLNLSDPQLPHLLHRITVFSATQVVGRIK